MLPASCLLVRVGLLLLFSYRCPKRCSRRAWGALGTLRRFVDGTPWWRLRGARLWHASASPGPFRAVACRAFVVVIYHNATPILASRNNQDLSYRHPSVALLAQDVFSERHVHLDALASPGPVRGLMDLTHFIAELLMCIAHDVRLAAPCFCGGGVADFSARHFSGWRCSDENQYLVWDGEGYLQCLLCEKEADDNHLASKKHLKGRRIRIGRCAQPCGRSARKRASKFLLKRSAYATPAFTVIVPGGN